MKMTHWEQARQKQMKLSILGLYNYNKNLFDNLVLPSQVDKTILVNNILIELAELESVYYDADFMQQAIGFWSQARLPSWEKIANVLYEEYDPFINIKRHEERTITQERDLIGTNNGTTTNNVNAWDDNSTNGVQRDKINADNTSTDKGTITTHEVYDLEGDSAITDAQDVMRKEVVVRTDYNIYQYIIKEFKNRFCLLVY